MFVGAVDGRGSEVNREEVVGKYYVDVAVDCCFWSVGSVFGDWLLG